VFRKVAAALAAFAIMGPRMQAQATPLPALKFEVASIKPCKQEPGQRGGGGNSSPGRLNVQCSPVRGLIRQAYLLFAEGRFLVGLPPPVEGGPAWIDSDSYEINARTESRVPLEMMNGPMLQVLLEDRFQLRVHRETREAPVYALTVAKNGPKLERFQEGSCTPVDRSKFPPFAGPPGPNQISNECRARAGKDWPNLKIEAQGMTLDEFSKIFLDSRTVDRPVIDKTGIAGRFNFHLEYALDGVPADNPATGPSIFTALQEQLGLRLEPARGPKEFLVIDNVERPSEN
jgi:uncharacterized protein (TIGR03435 family)